MGARPVAYSSMGSPYCLSQLHLESTIEEILQLQLFGFFFPNFSPVCRSTWKGGRYVVAVRDTKQRSAVPVAVFGALAYVIASDVN